MFRVHQAINIIVLVAGLAQALTLPLTYLEYNLRKEHILSELCKERYATINTCDGRCFVVNKLNQQQQKESEQKEQNIRPFEVKLFLERAFDFRAGKVTIELANHNHHFLYENYSYLFASGLDHPPNV